MANEDPGHTCDKVCFMCDRPHDTFRHIHLAPDHPGQPQPGEAVQGRELVLCIPCLAGLSSALSGMLSAYLSGGSAFDAYARKRARRHRSQQGEGTPLPKFVRDVLDEMMRGDMSDDDDGA